jgi:hypothetical protein
MGLPEIAVYLGTELGGLPEMGVDVKNHRLFPWFNELVLFFSSKIPGKYGGCNGREEGIVNRTRKETGQRYGETYPLKRFAISGDRTN